MLGWVWWPPLFIPALTSRSGGFCESEASLVYRPAKDIKQWNHISKQKSTTKNKNQPSAVAGRMPLIPAFGRQRQADFWVRGQPGLQSKFQDSQGYTEKPCLEKPKKKKKNHLQLISKPSKTLEGKCSTGLQRAADSSSSTTQAS